MADNKDWRDLRTPSDTLFANNSFYSIDDFSGRVAIYEDATATVPLTIDLMVRDINFNLDENIQVTNHVSDTFGIICFGKSPLRVTFAGILPDTAKTFGKQFLIDCYKNKLRLGAVARTGKVPVVKFGNYSFSGPFISMNVTEKSISEDTIVVILTMIVTAYQIQNDEGQLLFDYIHGVEEEAISVVLAHAAKTETKIEDETKKKEQVKVKPKKGG